MEEKDFKKMHERGITTRSFSLSGRQIDKETNIVKDAIFATQQPVRVIDWKKYRAVNEILFVRGITPRGGADSIRMLDAHDTWSGSLSIIGSGINMRVEENEKTGGNYVGDLRFSTRTDKAVQIKNLVEDKDLTDLSLGYEVTRSDELQVGERKDVNGVTYVNNGTEIRVGGKTYNMQSALPLVLGYELESREVSTLPFGADDESKIRELSETLSAAPAAGKPGETIIKETIIEKREEIKVEQKIEITEEDAQKRVDQALKDEQTRNSEIMATAENLNMIPEGMKAIADRMSVADFHKGIVNKKIDDNQVIETNRADLGMTDQEVDRYDFGAMIRAQILGDPELASFEHRVSRDLADKVDNKPNGFLVPHNVLMSKRILDAATIAAQLVGTQHLASSFIDLLRNKAKMLSLGVRMLTGLRGDVNIPKQNAAGTAYWLSTEATALTLGDQTFGTLSLTPKTVAAGTSFSRQLLLQSDPSISALVMDDLIRVLALAIDLAIIDGTGASGQPTGILNTTGIGAVDGVSIDWDKIVSFETKVENANADIDSMNFVSGANVKGILKGRQKVSGQAEMLWTGGNLVNGYPGVMTNQIPAATAIQGAFSAFLVALWGGLDVYVDPATLATTAGVVIRAFQSIDMGARQAASFSASENIS